MTNTYTVLLDNKIDSDNLDVDEYSAKFMPSESEFPVPLKTA